MRGNPRGTRRLSHPEPVEGRTAACKPSRPYAFLRLRYTLPGEQASRLIERPVTPSDGYASFDHAPAEARFAFAVAPFGELLRGDPYLKNYSYDDVLALAQPARGAAPTAAGRSSG